jgi:hypothetical protein
MVTAVWVAVVAFVIGVGVAVYVMLKAARLMTESSGAIASLREREDLLIERASATIDRAGEQIARTETITASMDGVTASMADIAASMAEMRGRVTALTPAARTGPDGTSGALTWTAALAYGFARALGLRWAAQYRFIRHRGPGIQEAAAGPARPAVSGRRSAAVTGSRPVPVTGQRRAALTSRRGKAAP